MHNLFLQFPNTPRKDAIVVLDASSYDADLAVNNRKLEVRLPGFALVQTIALPDGNDQFLKSINLVDLGLSSLAKEFADGVYSFRYSVAPNSQVNKEFFHFRRTQFDADYYALLTSIKFGKEGCECENQKVALDQLREAKAMVDAAEALVEINCVTEKASDLYTCAVNILNKINTGCK